MLVLKNKNNNNKNNDLKQFLILIFLKTQQQSKMHNAISISTTKDISPVII